MVFLKAADDDDGPEALGVDGAVTVGPTGVVDSLLVIDKCPGAELFLLLGKDEVEDAVPKEERRELALLPTPRLCIVEVLLVYRYF